MGAPGPASAFESAFAREILASECIRVRVLAVTLTVAIGDTVNLAARLEQLNKEFGSQLLVSDAVAAALGHDREAATPLGELPVRGYEGPVRVWRLA